MRIGIWVLLLLCLGSVLWYFRGEIEAGIQRVEARWSYGLDQKPKATDGASIDSSRVVDALVKGKREQVTTYLAKGGDPNAVNAYGDSLLLWSVSLQDEPLIKELLERGADPHLTGTYGASPVHWAARRGYLVALQLFSDRNIHLDRPNKELETPLMHAARKNQRSALTFLLQWGADPHARDGLGQTALIQAVRGEAWAVVEPLVLAGSDVELRAADGESALSLAVKSDQQEHFFGTKVMARYPDIRHRADALVRDQPVNEHQRPRLDRTRMAALIHELVNQERQKKGLRLLDYDSNLADIATLHSKDMAAEGYFNHVNLRGEDPTGRARRASYRVVDVIGGMVKRGVGENIFQGFTYSGWTASVKRGARHINYSWLTTEDLAESAVVGWMDSPGHRDNILNPIWHRQGIGIAVSEDEKVYITQNFW